MSKISSEVLEDMLEALKKEGVSASEIKSTGHIVRLFNLFCIPPAWEIATETAELVCTYRKAGTRPWKNRYVREHY